MEWAIPPEIWALAGVVLGTFIPSVMTFFTGRQQAKHEANKALIEALERRIGDLETHLREETSARRALEVEVRRREEEAHSTAARARLVMSVAVAHINRLNRILRQARRHLRRQCRLRWRIGCLLSFGRRSSVKTEKKISNKERR